MKPVYIVGAGPGDPSLLTLAAVERLRRADCVIYDGLVDPAVLLYAGDDAEKICVRKRTGPAPTCQRRINGLLVEKARCRKCVVRLKGGDPVLFARLGEELRALTEAGIPFEIIPGVTAGLAAAAYCGLLVTDKDVSSQLLFVTGREAPGKEESMIDWPFLAKFDGTIVFYMAIGTLGEITDKLTALGKSGDTPAAVIQNATLPSQRILRCSLATAAEECKAGLFDAPAIVVIGKAADFRRDFNWFAAKPLFGRRIGLTRDAKGNERFAQMLRDFAAAPVAFECLRIKDLSDGAELTNTLQNIGSFDWVVFTSPRGVECTFNAVRHIGKDVRVFGAVKIACIGPATAERLAGFGIAADIVPQNFTSAALARGLISALEPERKKVLLLRSAIATDELPTALINAGADITQISVYTTLPAKPSQEQTDAFGAELRRGLDWLTFTSASAVQFFFDVFSPDFVRACPVKIASIGPMASRQLKNLSVNIHLEAQTHTIEGLIDSIVSAEEKTR